MRRIAIIAAAVVAVLVVIAAAIPFILTTDVVKRHLADQITRWTGRPVTFDGEPEISVFPYLTLRLRDVTVGNPPGITGDPLISMDELMGQIDITTLLAGRLEVTEFRLVNPRIRLRVEPDGRFNWNMRQGSIGTQAAKRDAEVPTTETAPPSPRQDIRLGRFVVENGTIVFDNARTQTNETLSDVDIDFAWPTTNAAIAGTGGFTWHGEAVEFNGSISRPFQMMTGGASPVRFAFASPPLKINFTGNASRLDRMQIDGAVTIATPSVRRVFEWVGRPLGDGSVLGAGSITAQMNWAGSSASFADATIDLDGNSAEGALTFAMTDGMPDVRGTLAFRTLDLTAYAEALRANLVGATDSQSGAIDLPIGEIGNADLRLSAERLKLGALDVERVAATAAVKQGRLTVTVGDSGLYRGRGEARLTADVNGGKSLRTALQVKLTGIDVNSALAKLAGITALKGTGTASFDLTAEGTSWAAVGASLKGTGTIGLTNGALGGIDLGKLPAAIEAGGGAAPGSTPVTKADGSLAVSDGVVTVADLTAEGPGYTAKLTGRAWLASSSIEGRGTLFIMPPGAGTANPQEVPFLVSGTWAAPAFHPDLGSVIKREELQPAPIPAPAPANPPTQPPSSQ